MRRVGGVALERLGALKGGIQHQVGVGGGTVSYTHLDVYKRQGGGSRPRHLPEVCLSGRGGHQGQGLRRLRLSAAADVARAPKCGRQMLCVA